MIPTRTTRAEACRAATWPETSVVVIGRMTIQGRCIVMQPRPRRLDWYSVRDDLLHLRRTSSRRRAVLPALRVVDGCGVHELRPPAHARRSVLRDLRHAGTGNRGRGRIADDPDRSARA